MTDVPPPPGGSYPPPPPAGGYPPPPPPGGAGYPPPGGVPGAAPPENNLVWGILVTVLCCLPLGIVSIVKATQVNTLWAQGQYAAAQQAADDAKKWAIWGVIAGAVGVVLWFVVMVLMAIAGL